MEDFYSTHVSYSDISNFKRKNKGYWPEMRSFIGDKTPIFPNIYNKESLINSNHIAPTYKKKIQKLKDGEACFAGSNGGGRSQFVRKLTQEEILEIESLKKREENLKELRAELKKVAPEILDSISKLEKETQKQKEKMRKAKIWS